LLFVVGDYPSNVTNIEVSYTEDNRESYVDYSVAKVSWTPPDGKAAANEINRDRSCKCMGIY